MAHPHNFWYHLFRAIFEFGGLVWHRLQVYGIEKIPREGGCILASNHCSHLDPPLVGCRIRHRVVRYMARDTLMSNRFMAWLLPRLQIIPLDRNRGDSAALRASLKALKEGGLVCFFPEGTRSEDGKIQKAKGGVGFIIAKAKVPVVPARLIGAFEAYPKGAKFIKPSKVKVIYGDPILPEDLPGADQRKPDYEAIAQFIMDKIEKLEPDEA